MSAATEIQEVTDGLLFWQTYSPEVKADLSSTAVRAAEGWVLLDPVPLSRAAWEEFAALVENPAAVVLTNGNHARAAAEFGARLGIPLLAHAEAAAELEIPVDRQVEEGDCIAGDLGVVRIAGAGAGEIALHSGRGTLHVGDALINAEPFGFTFLPDKYCLDPKELRLSLRKLLAFDCAVLTFAHGLPLVSQARSRLHQLLA